MSCPASDNYGETNVMELSYSLISYRTTVTNHLVGTITLHMTEETLFYSWTGSYRHLPSDTCMGLKDSDPRASFQSRFFID